VTQEEVLGNPEETTQVAPEQPSAEALQQKLSELEIELEATRKEAKTHQANVSKKADELAKRQATDSRIEGMESKVDVLTAMMADLLDGESDEERPKKKSEDYLKRLQQTDEANKKQRTATLEGNWNAIANEADQLIKAAGLDMMDSPELTKAHNLFLRAGYSYNLTEAQKGLDEVKKVVGEKKVPKESDEERINKLADEKARKMLEDKGLLTTETGGPSGGAGSDEKFMKDFANGNIPMNKENLARHEKIIKS